MLTSGPDPSHRYIRSERSVILINFCLSIISSNALILIGQTQTRNKVGNLLSSPAEPCVSGCDEDAAPAPWPAVSWAARCEIPLLTLPRTPASLPPCDLRTLSCKCDPEARLWEGSSWATLMYWRWKEGLA